MGEGKRLGYNIFMRKTLIGILAVILTLLLVGLAYWFWNMNRAGEPRPDDITFPVGGGGKPVGDGMSVDSQSGQQIRTKDFLTNSITIEDPANKGNYYLAGSSGACRPDGTCPSAGTEENFSIVYFNSSRSFVVSLNAEPLGATRLRAEQYLTNMLGISKVEMCALKYDVLTTSYVSEQFAGEDLGFSFCPGAVLLP